MASITTTQAGDWHDTATWTGGSVPVAGTDSAVIDHAVEISTVVGVGTDPTDTTTLALTINADLTLTGDAVFTVRGNVQQTAAHIIMQAGAEVHVGSTVSSSQNYLWKFGLAHGDFNEFRATGSPGSRCIVRTLSGANEFSFEDAFQGGSNFVCSYTDFTDIGDATTHMADPYLASGDKCHFLYCRFDGCGEIQATPALNANSDFRLENCNFTDSQGTYCFNVQSGNALTGANRTLIGNYFDKEIRLITPQDFTITGNVINDFTMTEISGSTNQAAAWQDNCVIIPDQSFTNIYTDVTDDYWLLNYATANPHGISHSSPNSGRTYVVDGVIFEYDGTDSTGDMIGAGSTAAGAWNLDVKNCIVLPNPDGGSSPGMLFSALGDANLTASIEHNTVYASNTAEPAVALGETYSGHADMCDSYRSNLVWHATAAGTHVEGRSATVGMITEASCDYNGGWNVTAGSEGQGYDLDLTGTAGVDFGANDVLDTDPQFVDSTRNMAAWDADLGGPGTRANALTKLALMNAAGWDSAYTPAALHAWVKDGFRPLNAAYDGAAHDGGTIGAVAYTAPVALTIQDATHAHTADVADLDTVNEPFKPQFPINIYPWNIKSLDGYTFSRSGTATYIDADGVIQTAADGELRNSHYEGTARTILLEGASTNICNRSEEIDQSPWVTAGTALTITANDAVAPDGATTADNVTGTAAFQSMQQAHTVTNALDYTFSIWVSGSDRDTVTLRQASGTNDVRKIITISTGSVADGGGNGVGFVDAGVAERRGSWVRVYLTATSGGTTLTWNVYPDDLTQARSHTMDLWGGQVEQLSFPSSYIPTAGSDGTRNADSLSVDFTLSPQEMTVYCKGVERGTVLSANVGSWHIGDNTLTKPYLRQYSNASNYVANHGGVADKYSSAASGCVIGDTLEHAVQLAADGAVRILQSINGGADTGGTASAAETLQGAWQDTTLHIGSSANQPGYFAFQSIRIASGVRSMGYMRGQASTTTKQWRLRLHQVNTLIPEDATVEYAYNVEIAGPPSVGGQVVRPLEGRTESQPWSIKLVDVGSAITSTLGDSSNRAHLLNRIADISVSVDGGLTYVILATGRVSEIQLAGLAAYTINVVDERLVERSTTIFEGSAGTTSIWTPGFVSGSYGPFTTLPWQVLFAEIPYAKFKKNNHQGTASVVEIAPDTDDGAPLSLGRLIEDDVKADAPTGRVDVNAPSGNFDTLRLRLIGETSDREVLGVTQILGPTFYAYKPESFNVRRLLAVDPSDSIPSSSTDGYLYMPGSDPTEDNPLHIEATPVKLLKDIYDGVYSNGVGPRYDPTAMDALAFRLRGEGIGTLRWRIKSPANMARWVEDNIYKPLGIVPLIRADGSLKPVKVYPSFIEVADTEQLEDFTESNCRILDWRHAADESVNVVRGKYLVETQYTREALENGGKSALDLIEETEKEAEIVREGAPTPRRVHEIELAGWHTKGAAEALLAHRGREVFEMFGYGPLYVRIMAIGAEADAGDYVVVKHSALPAFNSARGSSRIMLVLSRTRHAAADEYQLIEVGATLQPLSAPTVTVQQTGSDPLHAVLVSISGFGSDWWELRVAANTTEPDTDSTLWRVVAAGQETQVVVNKLKSGTTHWFQARTRSTGRIPSDWSTAVSVATDQILAPTDLRITNNNHATLAGFAWDNFNNDDRIAFDLNGTRVAILPAGTTRFDLTGLTASTNYAPGVEVYHIGTYDGEGAKATALSFTTLSSDPQLDTPGLIVVRGQGTAIKVHW